MAKNQKLWCYAKAFQMVGHNFNDDVAVCWAETKKEALEKFKELYPANEDNVSEVVFNYLGIAILTDY